MSWAMLLSKTLSTAIVFFSFTLKLPTIKNLMQTKNAESISRSSTIAELCGYTLFAAYGFTSGFPFMTFGENCILALQTLAILYCLSVYSPPYNLNFFLIILAAWVLFIGAVFNGYFGPGTIGAILSTVNVPQMLMARIPQIALIYNSKTCGALSFFTIFLQTGGTAARVFTSVMQLADPKAIGLNLLSFTLNSVILGQWVYYDYLKMGKSVVS